jgi:hypothetical protein
MTILPTAEGSLLIYHCPFCGVPHQSHSVTTLCRYLAGEEERLFALMQDVKTIH